MLDHRQEALFLPGPGKELFSLRRYQEEVGKAFKQITLIFALLESFIIVKLLASIAMHQTLKMKIIQGISK